MHTLIHHLHALAALGNGLASFTNQLALAASVYGVVTSLSPTLQIVQMRRAGSSASLSRSYIAIGIGGYLIWFVYGLAMHNTPLIMSDAIGVAMQIAVFYWAYRLRHGPVRPVAA